MYKACLPKNFPFSKTFEKGLPPSMEMSRPPNQITSVIYNSFICWIYVTGIRIVKEKGINERSRSESLIRGKS